LRDFICSAIGVLLTLAFLGAGAVARAEVEAPLLANPNGESPTALTVQQIKERADAIAASSGLEESTRNLLSELYRQAIGSLEAAATFRDSAHRFESAILSSKEDVERLRADLEQQRQQADTRQVDVTGLALEDAELQLQEAKAERATIEARLAEITAQVDKQIERPAIVRQRVSETKNRIAEIQAEAGRQAAAGEAPEVVQARAWARDTRLEQLRARVLVLGQELASQPVRLEALRAQKKLLELNLVTSRKKVATIETAVNEARMQDTERAKIKARAAEAIAAGSHPLVMELAGRNTELSEEIDALAGAIENLELERKSAADEAARIERSFSETRQKIDVAGVSQILGRLLQEQKRSLPDLARFERQAKARERKVAETTLSKFLLEEERKKLLDTGTYVAALSADTPPEDAESIAEELDTLAENRLALVDKALGIQRAYLQAMAELDFTLQRLHDAVERLDEFLSKRLLWVRSSEVVGLDTMMLIPGQVSERLNPANWRAVVDTLMLEGASPGVVIIVLLVVGLRLARRSLLHMLQDSGRNVGNLLRDRLGDTFRALVIIMLLALPWPLLMFLAGRLLLMSEDAADFTKAVGQTLGIIAPLFLQLRAFRLLVAPGSVAAVHFGWRERGLERLYADLAWFTPLLLVTAFVTVLVIFTSEQSWGSGLGRAAFLMVMLLFSVFFYRASLPNGGTLSILFAAQQQGRMFRWRYAWFVLLVSLPLLAAGIALAGYMYTALTVIGHIIDTLWFTLLVLVFHQVIVRWLLLKQRALRLQAARERRRAEREARQAEERDEDVDGVASREFEEPVVDLKALDAASRRLTNNAFLLIGGIGIWWIWDDMLPALQVLDEVTLWSYTKPGFEEVIPITLLSLGLALLILAVMVIATRQLPAFLEITLLQPIGMSQGSRYTVVTLSKYTVVAVGVAWIFSALGGSWSEIQWIFAALGVGIGFGLQEIVANFISGLIILFERPIRVGDVVTVGTTDGIVTRIQIRATTIRNWDQQELLVPNKNFITQEVTNWSLSDQTTRILIHVGVAYGSDVDRAMLILKDIAERHPRMLRDPAPFVVFEEFGDNALLLSLRCYIDDIDFRLRTITEINQAIYRELNEAGIEIAFPQRDVHLDTRRPLDVRIQADSHS